MSQEDLFQKSLELLQIPVIVLELVSKNPLDFCVVYVNPQTESVVALDKTDIYKETVRTNFPAIEERFYKIAGEVIFAGARASIESASYQNRLGQHFVLDIEIAGISNQNILIAATRFAPRNSSQLRIYHKSNYDPLTSLLHREAFLLYAEKELKACQAAEEKSSLIIIDIDNFKKINDQQGHLAGDQALAEVAQIILSAIRYQDPAGRLGGDEMAVFLPGADRVRALEVAKRILGALQDGGLSASLGIAPSNDLPLQDLIEAADQAMYRAKEAGGNSIGQ